MGIKLKEKSAKILNSSLKIKQILVWKYSIAKLLLIMPKFWATQYFFIQKIVRVQYRYFYFHQALWIPDEDLILYGILARYPAFCIYLIDLTVRVHIACLFTHAWSDSLYSVYLFNRLCIPNQNVYHLGMDNFTYSWPSSKCAWPIGLVLSYLLKLPVVLAKLSLYLPFL